MQPDQIRSFFDRFTDGSYTQEEHQAFINWLHTAPIEEVEVVAEEYKQIVENRPSGALPNQDLIAKVEAALDQWEREGGEVQEPEPSTRVIRMWRKLAVAAVVTGLIALGVWFFTRERLNEQPAVVKNKESDIEAPAIKKAIITLADGRSVPVDSIASGLLAVQRDVKVVKNERGEIVYDPSSAKTQHDIAYNTLYNPKGSDVVSLTLADGTKVWLNSESSLQYPVAFAGNERKVSVTGEAYFEVEKNPKKPFKVQFASAGRKGTVEVLGTHFNVNAYDDEPLIETTLLEGSVKVNSEVGSIMLKPGEQASLSRSSHSSHSVEVQTVMAWKNGQFDFGEGTDLKQIMRQVARWYDVEVEYRGSIREEFGGTMPRGVTAASLLEKFEMTGRVKFKIQGRKVIVSTP
jgi:transmembrane sensor